MALGSQGEREARAARNPGAAGCVKRIVFREKGEETSIECGNQGDQALPTEDQRKEPA